jgi:hypothetical protein
MGVVVLRDSGCSCVRCLELDYPSRKGEHALLFTRSYLPHRSPHYFSIQ